MHPELPPESMDQETKRKPARFSSGERRSAPLPAPFLCQPFPPNTPIVQVLPLFFSPEKGSGGSGNGSPLVPNSMRDTPPASAPLFFLLRLQLSSLISIFSVLEKGESPPLCQLPYWDHTREGARLPHTHDQNGNHPSLPPSLPPFARDPLDFCKTSPFKEFAPLLCGHSRHTPSRLPAACYRKAIQRSLVILTYRSEEIQSPSIHHHPDGEALRGSQSSSFFKNPMAFIHHIPT